MFGEKPAPYREARGLRGRGYSAAIWIGVCPTRAPPRRRLVERVEAIDARAAVDGGQDGVETASAKITSQPAPGTAAPRHFWPARGDQAARPWPKTCRLGSWAAPAISAIASRAVDNLLLISYYVHVSPHLAQDVLADAWAALFPAHCRKSLSGAGRLLGFPALFVLLAGVIGALEGREFLRRQYAALLLKVVADGLRPGRAGAFARVDQMRVKAFGGDADRAAVEITVQDAALYFTRWLLAPQPPSSQHSLLIARCACLPPHGL